MAESELERRQRCSKCGESGEQEGIRPTQDFTKKAITMICKNQRCVWFETGWVITVMLDGSLPAEEAPEIIRAKPKAYPVLDRGVSGDERERQIKALYGSYGEDIKRS